MNALRDLYEVEALELLADEESTAKRLELHAEESRYPIKRKAALSKGKEVAADVPNVIEWAKEQARTAEVMPLFSSEAARKAAAVWIQRGALRNLCEQMGVTYPESEFGHACEVARLEAADWWGRRLRVADWRTFEMRKIRLGEVDRYCSLEIATAYQWHRAAIAQILDNLYAVREDGGHLMTLLEAANKSKSNPAIRRAAMIRQAKGMAELAAGRGWSWAFFTLTCPSKFHRMTTVEVGGRKVREKNPKWDAAGGPSPREGQQHLRGVWAKVRAAIARQGIEHMFCRVAEPHLDGCPHWHGIFWAHADSLPKILEILRKYGLEVDGAEPGAQERRVKWEPYKPKKAHRDAGVTDEQHSVNCAIGYLIAYIGKNIDGRRADDAPIGETRDRDGNKVDGDTVENAVRAVAWASLWGIRQFQFGGSAAIGPFDELRRVRHQLTGNDAPLEEARAAADRGDFATYAREAEQIGLELIVETSRDRIERLAEERGLDFAPTEELAEAALAAGLFNRWGEPARRWVLGVRDELGIELETRPHSWRVVAGDGLVALAESMADAGRRLLDMIKAKLEQKREALDRECMAVACAVALRFSGDREAAPLGPGSITVRASGQGLAADDGPPDGGGWGDGWQVDQFGIQRPVF